MNLPHTTSFDTTNITKSDYERLIRAERELDDTITMLKDLIFACEIEDPPTVYETIARIKKRIREIK